MGGKGLNDTSVCRAFYYALLARMLFVYQPLLLCRSDRYLSYIAKKSFHQSTSSFLNSGREDFYSFLGYRAMLTQARGRHITVTGSYIFLHGRLQ